MGSAGNILKATTKVATTAATRLTLEIEQPLKKKEVTVKRMICQSRKVNPEKDTERGL